MTLEEMKQRKKELGYTYARLSELSGVPLSTVQKIFGGATISPRYDTMLALESLLVPAPSDNAGRTSAAHLPFSAATTRDPQAAPSDSDTPSTSPMVPDLQAANPSAHDMPTMTASVPAFSDAELIHAVRTGESGAVYQAKQQGSYTLTDYYQIPDERRVELIDGVIYDMSAPGCDHQLIAGLIHAQLLSHVRARKGACLPMISPVDVQLDCDDRTMVQPDVVVVCDRSKVIRRCIYGAPDLVIEILSPSTRRKDVTLKLNKYLNAGVREYWIIDPEQCRVLVYDFSSAVYPVIYGFDAKVPVAIWDGDCVIDFQDIYDYIHFLYEKDPNPPQT